MRDVATGFARNNSGFNRSAFWASEAVNIVSLKELVGLDLIQSQCFKTYGTVVTDLTKEAWIEDWRVHLFILSSKPCFEARTRNAQQRSGEVLDWLGRAAPALDRPQVCARPQRQSV
jgi:hypothetical protein